MTMDTIVYKISCLRNKSFSDIITKYSYALNNVHVFQRFNAVSQKMTHGICLVGRATLINIE